MIDDLKQKINELFNNYERWYKPYNKETMFKALQADINNIFDKHATKTKEMTFILEDEEYDAFSLIYALADKGIINLEHENMEEEGVKVIL